MKDTCQTNTIILGVLCTWCVKLVWNKNVAFELSVLVVKTAIHWVVKWLLQSGGKVMVFSSGVEKSQRCSVISRKNRYLTHAPTETRNLAMFCRCIEVYFTSETSGPIHIKFPYCEYIKCWWGDLIFPTSETKLIVLRTINFLELHNIHFNIIVMHGKREISWQLGCV